MSADGTASARAVSLADQIRAASEHAERTLQALARDIPGVELQRKGFDFLDGIAVQAVEAVRTRRAVLCPHIDRRRPSVLHVFAHDPESVRCVPCSEVQGLAVRGTVEDRTCDGCGGVDPDGVYPGVFSTGPLLVSFGLCDDCRQSEWQQRSA
ncbi:MAG: hypothetical protein JWP11_1505 [Frankiales bacterium]|nr:hypothetical protein [Frankiales bacterium]